MTTKREAVIVDAIWEPVYAESGSGEPTETERLAGATPQVPNGAIPTGDTSSTARTREGQGRRVAAHRLPRMGREVHSPHGRYIPSLSVSHAAAAWHACTMLGAA
jgi:hypothetical protein